MGLMSIARLKEFLLARQGASLLAIILGAIALHIPLMLFHGYYDDLGTYVQWGDNAVQHLSTLYTATNTGGFGNRSSGFGFGGQGINYPPGMPYLFGALVVLFNSVLSPIFHGSLGDLIGSNGIGPFFAKIPILLADVGAVVLLYREARRRHSERFALVVAVSYACSPALLYDGAIWGQTDGLVSFPLLLAIFALIDESYILGGISLAFAILLKPQPIIFVPLMLLYLWRWQTRRNFWRFTGAGLITVLVMLMPVMIPHFQLLAMLQNIQTQSYNASSSLTSDAFNFWWLVGDGQQSLGTTIFGIASGILGDILFGTVILISCLQIWRQRDPTSLCFGMAIALFGFFMFMGGQHERYLFMFIPLMLASSIIAPRQKSQHMIALYLLGTTLCLLNMVIGVGGGSFANSQFIPFLSLPALSSFFTTGFAALGMLIAFAQFGTFVYAVVVYLNYYSAPAALREPSHPRLQSTLSLSDASDMTTP